MQDGNGRYYDDDLHAGVQDMPEGEPQDMQDDAPDMIDNEDAKDACEHFYKLLDYLQNALENARAVPLTNSRLVDAGMCVDIIQNLRGNIPETLQLSEQIVADSERIKHAAEQHAANRIESANARANAALDDAADRANRIIADAQTHADNIVKDAEVRARAMIDQNSIKIAAQNEARDIINEASAEATERRIQAADYCDKILRDAENALRVAYEDVRRNRQNLSQNGPSDRV